MPTVVIISVYIGRLPGYFPVWLESCRRNPSVDFVLVVDQKVETQNCKNVKILNYSLRQIQNRAINALGFDVKINTPFKLCDYKPAYGVIFSDVVEGYDYWGHCDIDLIWGDLRTFFNKYEITDYDKFLPLGHLSIYRNNIENNNRFRNSIKGVSDYRKVYQDEDNYLFDELGIIHIYDGNYPFFNKIIFADIWPWKKRYTMCTFLKYYQSIYDEFASRNNPINLEKQIFMWEDGKIYQYYEVDNKIEKREYIYIHIQKRNWFLDGQFSNRMIVSDNVVKAVNEKECILQLISHYNHYSFLRDRYDDMLEFLKHCWSYFKRKIIKTEHERIIVEK